VPLSERDRRTLVIGGIVIGVLLVALLLVNLLGGDGAPPGGVTARPPQSGSPGPGTGSPTPTQTPSTPGGGGPAGRDPFSIPAIFSVAPPSTSGTGTGTGTSTSTTTSPPPSGPTTSSSTPPPTQPGNGSSTNQGGHEVVLLDVFRVNGNGAVDVEVDGLVYTVLEGETFGPNDRFQLVSTSGNCASFLFGDESFSLCVTPQK
jgi:hypothetical protein